MYDPALKTLRLETSGAEWWGDARRIERPKTGGARLIWKNAVRNMRDGTSDTYNLDGLYFQISDITRDEGKDGAQLSIQIGTADNDYAGFYGDSLALVLDTVSGEVRAYPGGGTIIRSEALRHSAIEGKTLMFEINLTDDGLYSLTVRKDGTALKGIITASAVEYAKVGALTDTEEVLVAITPWGEDGTATASFAATLLSIQSTGGYAFEQWIDLVFAIDALPEKADRGNTDNILELYGRYCKLSRNLKERVTNYGKLAGLMNQIYEMELVDYSYLDNWLNEDGTFQVQTGDSQPVTIFAIIMILSLAVLILTAKHKGRAG